MQVNTPILKYPGAKWRIAKQICNFIDNIPHTTYLEPFFGSGAVFFNKKPSAIETINDLDGNVVNLFRVIRERPEELAALAEMTPWARDEYYSSYTKTGDELEDARRFLIRCWQAFGVKTSDRTGWCSDIAGRGSMYTLSKWTRLPIGILQVCHRLKNVQIENQAAIKLLERYSSPKVLVYADPPYPLITRSKRMYVCEMTDDEHYQLLNALDQHPGPVLLSSYDNDLYSQRLKGWHKVKRRAWAEHGKVREEILWLNPIAIQKQRKEIDNGC